MSLRLTTEDIITITVKPYETLPFPNGFKCEVEGVFPHSVNCSHYWLCQKEGKSEDKIKPVKLFQCPKGYLFDRNILFCNNEDIVECHTMNDKDISEALQHIKETKEVNEQY